MGEVYRATDTRLHRSVAIKILGGDLDARADLTQRLSHEARVLSALNHPNICTLYDVVDAEGQPALIMELLEGETLAQRLGRGPIPLPEVVNIGVQVASALGAAHQKGILHRDVKPGNIFILSSGHIKVLDFGLAKATGAPEILETQSLSSSPMTAPGAIVGTTVYLAPEQALGEQLDARSDIFSLGVVLYQLCTGELPFSGKTIAALFEAHLHPEPIPVRERNP
jgi:eukaryotic-like serine/threonine-protein kinase